MFKTTLQAKVPGKIPSVEPDQGILTAAKGGGIVFIGRLFQYGSRFLIALLTARLLGAEQLGLCSLALSAVFITSNLASLGLTAAMVRYVSLFANRRDTDRLWGTLQTGLGLTAVTSTLMGLGLFALADPIAEQLFHEPELIPLLQIISLAIPFVASSDIIVATAQGFKNMEYGVIGNNVSRPIIRLLLLLVLAIVGLNASKAMIAFTIAAVITFFLLLYLLNNLFPLKQPLRTARRNVKEMLRFSLPLYLSNLIQTFGGNIQ
ncbi:MAG: hypothetical protein DRQ24_11485, partial [Candidatus Latescibacterota bacterium]